MLSKGKLINLKIVNSVLFIIILVFFYQKIDELKIFIRILYELNLN